MAQSQTDAFMALADPKLRPQFDALLEEGAGSWATMQRSFLRMIDAYIETELAKPVEDNVEKHEAGGQWRIAFPHLALRHDARLAERLHDLMVARKEYQDSELYHGFADTAEVHHEIETFLYFQLPLFYSQLPGSDVALESILDVAHHLGNWADDAPDWYDWDAHEFRSTWLGTREVKAEPPHDYQEANHFRFVDLALAAFLGTGERQYMDLACDYADRWCEHIETAATAGEPIRCSILPAGAAAGEMGFGGKRRDGGSGYKVFYATVACNTAYDMATAMMDLCRITGKERYINAGRLLIDQFFENGAAGRPAVRYTDGEWQVASTPKEEIDRFLANTQAACMLSRPALRHDMISGMDYYRDRILEWANTIDEERVAGDQMASDVLVAAHMYSGDASLLERAYAMAIRHAAVAEADDGYHQCNSRRRQGARFLMLLLYQPLLGGTDWGTRGNVPMLRFKHTSPEGQRLPGDLAFRTWRVDRWTDAFVAQNLGAEPAEWRIVNGSSDRELTKVETLGAGERANGWVRVNPGEEVAGRVTWS